MSEQIIQLLVAERDRLDRAIEALHGSSLKVVYVYEDPTMPEWVRPASKKAAPALKKKKGFSAARRRKLAEGQKRRYAAINAAKAEAAAPKKRTMSAEGRQRIIDATKARWATINAAKAEAVERKKKTKSGMIAEAIAPKEDQEFKSKMSIAMAKSWAKRKKAAAKGGT